MALREQLEPGPPLISTAQNKLLSLRHGRIDQGLRIIVLLINDSMSNPNAAAGTSPRHVL